MAWTSLMLLGNWTTLSKGVGQDSGVLRYQRPREVTCVLRKVKVASGRAQPLSVRNTKAHLRAKGCVPGKQCLRKHLGPKQPQRHHLLQED